MGPPVSPGPVSALLDCHWLPAGHELVERLQRVVGREAVGEPQHDPGVGALVHLGGQEQGVAPEAVAHGVLKALLLVAVQKVVAELGSHPENGGAKCNAERVSAAVSIANGLKR